MRDGSSASENSLSFTAAAARGAATTAAWARCYSITTIQRTRRFLSTNRFLAAKPWKSLLSEAAKCDPLCLNCHMEVEHADAEELLGRGGFEPPIKSL